MPIFSTNDFLRLLQNRQKIVPNSVIMQVSRRQRKETVIGRKGVIRRLFCWGVQHFYSKEKCSFFDENR